MKNKLLVFSTLMAFLAIILSACSDYLETPLNGGASVETFYASDEDAELAIIATYDILTWHENSWGWASPVLIKTLPSDEGTCGGADATDQPNYQALDNFTHDAQNGALLGTWNVNYYGIFRANMAINNLVNDSDTKKRVIAEAKALRAYFYLELVTQFGDVPLVLTELLPDEYNQSRNSVAEVYTQIELDLNEAIADLPEKSTYGAADKFRMSKGTAYALLGKAQLYQENWSGAATTFDVIINSGEYSLEPNFRDIFRTEGEFGVESLLEASYSSEVPYNWGNYPWGTRHEDNIHVQLMGIRAGGIDSIGIVAGWGFNYPSPKLYNAYLAAGDSARLANTIITEAEYMALSKDDDFDGSAYWDYNGFFRLKYGSFSSETNPDEVAELNYGTNWRLIRYADILLMAAEAKYRDGNESGALAELNKVRTRANLDPVSTSGAGLFDAIVNERMLELAFEGFRYYDLIRWGLAEQELGSLGYTARHAVFPIPATELAAASNMTQNTDW